MNERPPFFTGEDIARFCKVSLRTVENWRYRRRGPAFILLPNGNVRYPKKEAYAFIAAYRGFPCSPKDLEGVE